MKFKKSTRFLLSLCLMTLTFLCGGNKAWGQAATTLFLEDFGSPSTSTAVASYSGWSAKESMFTNATIASNYSSPDGSKINSSSASSTSNYDAASGNGNIYNSGGTNTTKTVLQITNINIEGYSDITLNFGCYFSNTAHKVDVSYIIDNGTETVLNLDAYTVSKGGIWLYLSGGIPTTGKSLTLIFKHTTTKGWLMRLDDIKVTGVASTTPPAPTFSHTTGTYNGPQHVTITAPEGYTGGIFYTTDGSSDPATSGIVYTSDGIDITTTTTLRAVARNSEGNFSGEATATYTITYNAPTFSLAGGTYYGDQSVTISVADPGTGSILYTTNGTDPKTNGKEYTGAIPLPVGTNLTLKAVAKYGEGLFSEVTEATYDIQKKSPSFYQRISSAAELTANETYLIVCESKSKAFGKISNKKGTPQTVKITGNKIDLSADGTGTPTEFILEKSNESGYLLKNPTTGKYIVLVDDTNVTETETGTALNISFKTDGSAKIYKSGTTRQILYRASSYNVFGNYGNDNVSASGYNKVYLYKKHVIKEFSDTEDLATSLPTSPLADQTVTLDRNLYSGWNTFCVPFALTQKQLEEAYGSGAVAKYLSGVTTDGAAATLHFTPENGGGIEANKAYLLYLTADVTEAKTFSGVTLQPAGDCTTTVSADNGGDYTFQGILTPTALETNDRQYFLNSAGTYFVLPLNNTSQMKATRAYIIVPAPAAPAQGRQYSFDFNGTTTAIDNVNVSGMEDGAWYTISGIRINRPAAKGVYIHNGRKVIVK